MFWIGFWGAFLGMLTYDLLKLIWNIGKGDK